MSSSAPLQSPTGIAATLEPLVAHVRVHSFVNFVSDMERSLRFYTERLGFNLIGRTDLAVGPWAALAPPDGLAMLLLIAPNPASYEYKLIGQARHGVLVAENVDALFREWSARGVSFRRSPAATPWGGLDCSFEDPDGNILILVGYDGATREFEDQRISTQELQIAKQVQARLFPQMLPPLSTLDYAGICLQARQVGGDYYDFLDLGQEHLGLVIADISGKGIAASLLMANLQANLRSQCATAAGQPREFLQSVNQLFHQNTGDSNYATLFFADYDDRTRRLRYANCGHWPGLVLRQDNSVERLSSTSTVLGLFQEWDSVIAEAQLHPGDTLVLYTDGVSEAHNAQGEEFGEQRLADVLRCHARRPSQDLLTALLAEVQQFSPAAQQDDITFIIAKCR
jgi:catechol 2,3-dioxygenase-like lactoylglutathione lyase family enzyme